MNRSTIETGLSRPRLRTYLVATEQDWGKALNLYSWNASLSAAFMVPVGHTEVFLRNTLHNELASHYKSPTWYQQNDVLDDKGTEDIRNALDRLSKGHTQPAQVIVNLQFGFWRFLLSSQYEKSLWVPALHKGFQTGTNRKQLARAVVAVNEFRNRIAHHEPIFNKKPARILQHIHFICTAINPQLGQWVNQQHNIKDLLKQNPLEH